MNMELWQFILLIVLSVLAALVAGAFIGFQFAKKKTQQYLRDNPPISEKQIRAMYQSMGRTPSESQIQGTLRAMGLKK